MRRTWSFLVIFAAAAAATCTDQNPESTFAVSMQDLCDSTSFNAALGPGTCRTAGGVTFSEFNAELQSTQQVAAWRFVPTALTLSIGDRIRATNDGGEMHTFTEVEEFGGGIVPELNSASGNTTVAPECEQLSATDMVAAGAAFTTDAETEEGTELYQCCIHPWMRATVTVRR